MTPAMQKTKTSLFEKLGGRPAVETVVNEFYKRVLGDNQLKDFFAKTDMVKQKRHQVDFVSMALGGPIQYTGRTMKKAHEGMKITAKHFDLVAGHLVGALKHAGVAQDDINQVVGAVAPLKGDVVSA